MENESRVKLVCPGEGSVEIAGTTEFVSGYVDKLSIDFMNRLCKRLKNFKGSLEMVERPLGDNLSIKRVEINETEFG